MPGTRDLTTIREYNRFGFSRDIIVRRATAARSDAAALVMAREYSMYPLDLRDDRPSRVVVYLSTGEVVTFRSGYRVSR